MDSNFMIRKRKMTSNTLIIICSRIIGIILGTIRIKLISENRKILASTFGFFEMIVFAISIGLTVLNFNVVNVLAYASGMAIGTYLGLETKERFL